MIDINPLRCSICYASLIEEMISAESFCGESYLIITRLIDRGSPVIFFSLVHLYCYGQSCSNLITTAFSFDGIIDLLERLTDYKDITKGSALKQDARTSIADLIPADLPLYSNVSAVFLPTLESRFWRKGECHNLHSH